MISREVGIGLGVLVALAVGGGIAYAASSSKPSPTPGPSPSPSPTPSTPSTTAPTSAVGAPSAGGWTLSIVLVPGTVSLTAWPGDVVAVSLPTGCAWRSGSTQSDAPSSGAAPYSFTWAPSQILVTFNWLDAQGNERSTIMQFAAARTWAPASTWHPFDTVRLSVSQVDLNALGMTVQGWRNAAAGTLTGPAAAELAALNAIVGTSMDQAFALILTAGPWGQAFQAGPIASVRVYGVGDTLPADWPSDQAGYIRAEFQYQGSAAVLVSALPFPVTSWVRVT